MAELSVEISAWVVLGGYQGVIRKQIWMCLIEARILYEKR